MVTSLDRYGAPAPPAFRDFPVLDPYAFGVVSDEPRITALATISAGKKGVGDTAYPTASRDGTIELHDAGNRAPGLKAALDAREKKSLLVAFPFNDPNQIIQQRFVRYTASRLEAYGDEREITVITPGATKDAPARHLTYPADTDRYRAEVASCKASYSVYFTLAEWDDQGPAVVMPDGFGFYRLRTTSKRSIGAILSSLRYVARFTGGRIAGLPFELRIVSQDVAGQDGARRKIPVWTAVMRPPEGQRLDSRTFQIIASQSLSAGAALMLPAPDRETMAMALLDAPIVDDEIAALTDKEASLVERGGLCDAAYWNRTWHAMVKDTLLAGDTMRHDFIEAHTGGRLTSLADFLAQATEDDAAGLLSDAQACIDRAERATIDDIRDIVANGDSDPDNDSDPDDDSEADHDRALTEDAPIEYSTSAVQPEHSREAADRFRADILEEAPKHAPAAPAAGPSADDAIWGNNLRLRIQQAGVSSKPLLAPSQDRTAIHASLMTLAGGKSTAASDRVNALLRDLTGRKNATCLSLHPNEATPLLAALNGSDRDRIRRLLAATAQPALVTSDDQPL